MPKKLLFKKSDEISTEIPFEIMNMSATAAEGSPLASLGYKSDDWKAYIYFDICHALPNVIGPVMEGNMIGYTADALSMSHTNLIHQQVNIAHKIKAYDPKNVTRDRIIGCVVATAFPRTPLGGWKMAPDAKSAPCIQACAVVFKLAEGVNQILGQHLASRQKQSVSIESITNLGNIGLWLASKPDVIVPLLEPGDLASAVDRSQVGNVKVGKDSHGEQVVMIYGIGEPVDFRGVGVTPRPAERIAEITAINAELSGLGEEWDGGTLMAIAAERVDEEMVGQTVKFRTGRSGVIREVYREGEARANGIRMAATAERPIARIELPDKRNVIRPLSGLLS